MTGVGRAAIIANVVRQQGAAKHRVYHCCERRTERNNMSDAERSCEMKVRSSPEDWKRQRVLASHLKLGK